jgi:hypothetical protein
LGRLFLLFFIPLLFSCKSTQVGSVADMDYPFRTAQRFEFHQSEIDPMDFFDPLKPKVFLADMKSFVIMVGFELEYLNLRWIDAHAHDIMTLYAYQIQPGIAEPTYHNTKIKYPTLASLTAGTWVLDIMDEERNLLVFRGWSTPNPKAKDPAEEVRKCAQQIVSQIPNRQ